MFQTANRKYSPWILSLALLIWSPGEVIAAAVDQLRTFIRETQTVRAHFSQTLLDKNARNVQKSSGTLEFERPDKFRWIYQTPYEQSIVGDGRKVWFYDHDLNQVTVREFNIAIGSSPAALLAGNSTIEDNFELIDLGIQDEIEWMEAIPKNRDSAFEFIQLGFSHDGVLQYMALRDNFGQTTYLTFSELIKNPVLPDNHFEFAPPDGADVISE
ncbi:outer membrane lipoprotein chaperone LolA [Nitrosomonas marina]|uniref:Outer-membrane lipoprotein carrier protein n=1 Tax=Nitrosomonas marina TaxID=917 RepID=A0A1H8ECD6_9PROT|nr:outer membrane lipoprotein chaperone LolA [Nitrosomonas marina]SEN17040.1 outer membrane lipoprotein carrier protein [Nitrosomonas marina]